MFICPKCGNEDPKKIGVKNGIPYCRSCISFSGRMAEKRNFSPRNVPLHLDYDLTEDQKNISGKVIEAYRKNQNVLIHAVCGAGKTELVFGVIAEALSEGKQVGFAVPRRDVVIDLFPRFKSAFPTADIVDVYGGHNDILEGEMILLTTHQLFRYEDYFDLLIFDEADAFPYDGNEVLEKLFQRASRGSCVMMSATPVRDMEEKTIKSGGIVLKLQKRHHGHPLPVPKIRTLLFGQEMYLLMKMRSFYRKNLPFFVFVPTVFLCERIFRFCHRFYRKGTCVHSRCKDRSEKISDFKNGAYLYLITTSVLERGVTIKNLQVIVLYADHGLYDEKTLVQISGRVGRKTDAWDGEVIWIGEYVSEEMEKARQAILRANGS